MKKESHAIKIKFSNRLQQACIDICEADTSSQTNSKKKNSKYNFLLNTKVIRASKKLYKDSKKKVKEKACKILYNQMKDEYARYQG